jgi:uncharacterized protein YkwD
MLLFAALTFSSCSCAFANSEERVSATAIIHELNLARQNPASYGRFLQESSNIVSLSADKIRAVNEAIRFLRTAQPRAPLALSPGLCRAAADHCRDQAKGAIGHNGSNRSNAAGRINRYGIWQGAWAENISYGRRTARQIVVALIVDAGVRGRGHRKNIFNPRYHVAGAASGPHPRFGRICDIDFAGAYVESALASAN